MAVTEPRVPLVGRKRELSRIASLLDSAESGKGQTLVLFGEGGVGKTRLVDAAAERARKRGWTVAIGRGYPVETGVPYALFTDALGPMVTRLDAGTLTLLTRGATAELATVFPNLAGGDGARASSGADPSEIKARLMWTFSQFLSKLAAKQPLLLALENLQWADASSLELLHFVARQLPSGSKIAVIATYNEAERDANPALRTTEQSLVQLGVASVLRLDPLSEEEVLELLREKYDVDAATLGSFPALLYAWTRGNPFFIDETLKALGEGGTLRERDGRWLGWEVESFQMPPTVRDAIAVRLDRLSADARSVANLAAVIGARVTYDALLRVAGLDPGATVAAIDELRSGHVFQERSHGDVTLYDFAHPLIQQVLYSSLGQARAGLLHATVAEALENAYGASAEEHADELAFHFARAHGHAAPKAAKYLAIAGRGALHRYANREAAGYLAAALEQNDALPGVSAHDRLEVTSMLARARQRLGDYDAALRLWKRALELAAAAGAGATEIAGIRHRMGLACYWSGRYEDALTEYDAALGAVDSTGDDPVVVRVRLARAICLQDFGRFDEAATENRAALAVAERIGNAALLARAHRALLLMYAWSGPSDLAREHGERAIRLAAEAEEQMLLWSAHWGMGMLAGLSGDATGLLEHLAAAERIGEALGSPLLPLWSAEFRIQYCAGAGDWETGIATGERTIALARSFGQKTLLPRVLVWTAFMYLERGDATRAKEMLDEAWRVSGAGATGGRVDIPSVVPAQIGMARFYMTTGNFAEACRIGEAALALADSAGHRVWAVRWLLPLVMESRLRSMDFDAAAAHGRRLWADGERLGDRLAVAFAHSCEGLLIFHRDNDPARAIPVLRSAVEELEAIPYPYNAARVRREVARALAQSGDRDGAIAELRRAHEVFARLGATTQLALSRDEMRALGARPPVKASGTGAAGLTGRELEIARMVAQRKANKEIGSALRISARTVSTHLSNIFAKVGVESRGELADFVRERGLLDE